MIISDITEYVEFMDVRMLLGVDDHELTDDMLYANLYRMTLTDLMYSVSGVIDTIDSTERNLIEWFEYMQYNGYNGLEELEVAIPLLATFHVAITACRSMPMFAWVEKSDAYAKVKRESGGYASVCDKLYDAYMEQLADIKEILGIEEQAMISGCFTRVPPKTDIITGADNLT